MGGERGEESDDVVDEERREATAILTEGRGGMMGRKGRGSSGSSGSAEDGWWRRRWRKALEIVKWRLETRRVEKREGRK